MGWRNGLRRAAWSSKCLQHQGERHLRTLLRCRHQKEKENEKTRQMTRLWFCLHLRVLQVGILFPSVSLFHVSLILQGIEVIPAFTFPLPKLQLPPTVHSQGPPLLFAPVPLLPLTRVKPGKNLRFKGRSPYLPFPLSPYHPSSDHSMYHRLLLLPHTQRLPASSERDPLYLELSSR